MKKIVLLVITLFLLSGCVENDVGNDLYDKYDNMIAEAKNSEYYEESSAYFDISLDIADNSAGNYRFYIIIDNSSIAMYDIEAVAVEKDEDYSNKMAACIGIFEDLEYSMVPGQVNIDNGYMKGMSISGLTTNPSPVIYLLIQWKNSSRKETYKHYYKLDFANIGA